MLTAALFGGLFVLLRKSQHIKYLPKIGWVYCLFSPNFPYKAKVGYSAKPDARREEIRASLERELGHKVHVWTVCMMPMFFARDFEQAIHNSKFWISAKEMRGSGRTEWSWTINVISALTTLIVLYLLGYDKPSHVATIVLLLPVPIDFCLFILLFAAAQVGVVVGAFYLFF
jgi:hypothetical protein